MDDLFLGVDGGGTRCRARLRDRAGRRLGEAEGGLANIYQDFDRALDSIATTAAAAIAAAGLPPEAIGRCRAGLGLAGVTDAFRARAVVEAGCPSPPSWSTATPPSPASARMAAVTAASSSPAPDRPPSP
ncbi:BadF/BadG/BcrA/BcrD ATPase family protein [Methyloraptor flagellatus]|uniref:BadF/BadG/BcrA/BcrD ATPase family protein n=1 Tax=Methyloraptor flagellatus TaxID=3162530 RepID=A0AAU7X6X0_9HYPH